MKLTDLLQHTLTEITARFRATPTMVQRAKSSKTQVFVEMPAMDFLILTTDNDDEIKEILAKAQPLSRYNRWAKIGDKPEYRKFVLSNPEVLAKSQGRMDEPGDVDGMDIHPYLRVDVSQKGPDLIGRVRAHEGRHRAASVLNRGGNWFPVGLALRADDDLEIPGMPSYENPEYYMGRHFLPPQIIAQYRKGYLMPTAGWKIVREVPLRKSARPVGATSTAEEA